MLLENKSMYYNVYGKCGSNNDNDRGGHNWGKRERENGKKHTF